MSNCGSDISYLPFVIIFLLFWPSLACSFSLSRCPSLCGACMWQTFFQWQTGKRTLIGMPFVSSQLIDANSMVKIQSFGKYIHLAIITHNRSWHDHYSNKKKTTYTTPSCNNYQEVQARHKYSETNIDPRHTDDTESQIKEISKQLHRHTHAHIHPRVNRYTNRTRCWFEQL